MSCLHTVFFKGRSRVKVKVEGPTRVMLKKEWMGQQVVVFKVG